MGPAPNISRGGSNLPTRMVLHGVEGIGKTSLGAFAPKPIFGMTKGETGLLTLIDNNLVGPTDHFDEFLTWHDLLWAVEWLTANERGSRTFVLDTGNGAQQMCFAHVCEQNYGGDWESFNSFGRGAELAIHQWGRFLTMLDELRARRKMAVLLLCHTRIRTFKNPLGEDYDRYVPDLHKEAWGLLAKWADAIIFGQFEAQAYKAKGALKAKVKDPAGRQKRIMYTVRTAAWDAKNRVGLPPQISMGSSGREAWSNLLECLRKSRQQPPPEQQPAAQPAPNQAPAAQVQPGKRLITTKTAQLIQAYWENLSWDEERRGQFLAHWGLTSLAGATDVQGKEILHALAEEAREHQPFPPNGHADQEGDQEGERKAIEAEG